MELLQYDFMRRAFVVGVLLAVMIPCIGVVVVLRRLSMIGDALSHASLAGVAAGLLMGANPIVGSVTACVVSALGVEAIRKKIPRYAELSIAVALSAGVGLAGILSGFLPGSAGFNSFLFGSIVAITNFEMGLVVGISLCIMGAFVLLYKELFAITFDEGGARLSGVRVSLVNFIFTLLTAVTISVAARTVGALMVSSLMVIPVVSAMQTARSYRGVILHAVGFAVLFTLAGLSASYYLGRRPGATIVTTGVAGLLLLLIGKRLFGFAQKRRRAA
jgi:zinc transport system permease protein